MVVEFPGLGEVPADANERLRFLHMATLGVSPESAREIFDVKARSWRHQWITRQSRLPRAATHIDTVAAMEPFFAPGVSRPSSLGGTYYHPAGSKIITVRSLWKSFIESPDQLRQRVTAALLSIFSLNQQFDSIGSRRNSFFSAGFADLVADHAFGNFRDLLSAVSKSPAMGGYLTFEGNQKAAYDADGKPLHLPDENYAREVLQLFSIGLHELTLGGEVQTDADGRPVETYVQDDIVNLARVFTGWKYPEGKAENIGHLPMDFYPSRHSPEAKTFLGQTIPAGTDGRDALEQAIDIIFNHPNVAPFVSRHLIQRMVMSNPPADYVAAVATKFQNNGSGERGDLLAVVREILTHPAAQTPADDTATGDPSAGKLREPMMRLTAVARLMGAKSTDAFYPIGKHPASDQGLGQAPLTPPSIFHFFRPGFAPAGSDISKQGLVGPEFQISSGAAIPTAINFLNEAVYDLELMLDCDLDALIEMAWQPEVLLDYVNLMLTGGAVPQDHLSAMADALSGIIITQQAEDKNLRRRMRGAIRLIAAHPSFLVQS